MYESLNDAAEAFNLITLSKGRTQVWYQRPEFYGDIRFGDVKVDPQALEETHIKLGEIHEKDPETIWQLLQAHNWSPESEAYDLIRRKGLRHTSMDVGDVVATTEGVFMVAACGFKKLA